MIKILIACVGFVYICASAFLMAPENGFTAFSLIELERIGPMIALGYTINSSTLTSLGVNFKQVFKKMYEATQADLLKLAMLIDSKTSSNEYGWLNGIPGFREWIDDRVAHQLSVDGYTIKNKKWENTIQVDRDDIENDNIGIYKPVLELLAEQAKLHPLQLLIQLMLAGETNLCFDKKPFFAPDHPNGFQGTFSNLLTAKPFSRANYILGRALMQNMVRGSDGASLGISPTHLLVSPDDDLAAREVIHAATVIGDETVGGSKENVLKGDCQVVVVPELAATGDWYIACLNKVMKPFIIQTREKPKLVSITKEDSEQVFMKDSFLYGAKWKGNVGYALPQLCVKMRKA